MLSWVLIKLEELQCLDSKEETGLLSGEERRIGIDLKEEYRRKVREEEIMWGQGLDVSG